MLWEGVSTWMSFHAAFWEASATVTEHFFPPVAEDFAWELSGTFGYSPPRAHVPDAHLLRV